MEKASGGCLCGKVRIEVQGQPYRVGICHCLDCRKHHGAVFYAAAIFPREAVTVTGATNHYKHRHFCPTCGSSVFAKWDDEVEVHLGTFDEPSQFVPSYEGWVVRREGWLPEFPGLTCFQHGRTGQGRTQD